VPRCRPGPARRPWGAARAALLELDDDDDDAQNRSEGGNRAERLQGAVAGYIRVSTRSQDYSYQRAAIDAAARARGDAVGVWFADVASGSSLERPELARLRAALDAGRLGRVWVWRLDRLTRSGIADTLECVSHVRRCGAELVSVADQVALDGGPAGELVLAVLAWCAQLERTKIRENQDAARARMSLEGRSWGRPPLPPTVRDAVIAAASHGFSRREIARQLKVSKSYVDRVLRQNEPEAAA
jgi:DNA invertase Pin-like site-specific DNA recombinase